jgi:hypothetical protein
MSASHSKSEEPDAKKLFATVFGQPAVCHHDHDHEPGSKKLFETVFGALPTGSSSTSGHSSEPDAAKLFAKVFGNPSSSATPPKSTAPQGKQVFEAPNAQTGTNSEPKSESVFGPSPFGSVPKATMEHSLSAAGGSLVVVAPPRDDKRAAAVGTSFSSLCSVHREVVEDKATYRDELAKYALKFDRLATDVGDIFPGVGLHEKIVLRGYTGKSFHSYLNQALRGCTTFARVSEFSDTIRTLHRAIQAIPLDPGVDTLWRGQSSTFGDTFTEGGTVTFNAFTSTSASKASACAPPFTGNVLFCIRGVTDQLAASVNKISAFPNEKEVLLRAGVRCRVISCAPRPGGKQQIDLQVLGLASTPEADLCPACKLEALISKEDGLRTTDEAAATMLRQPEFVAALNRTSAGMDQLVWTQGKKRGDSTWLYVACRHGYPETVKALLENGAHQMRQNSVGSTALHAAAYFGDLLGRSECVKVMIEGARRKCTERLRRMLSVRNTFKATAVEEARGAARELLTVALASCPQRQGSHAGTL